jgi:cell wall-associated NlpC family hydrolase
MPLRRTIFLLFAAFLVLAAPAGAAAPSRGSWDPGAQQTVMRAGLIPPLPGAGFAGDRVLTAGQLRAALTTYANRTGTQVVDVPSGRVTVISFDRALVRQLGLDDVALAVYAETKRAGLHPPRYFGTEAVARQLALRFTQPHGQEAIELFPGEAITRAEAAWSFAQLLRFNGSQQDYDRQVFARYHLPRLTAAQKRPLRLAVSKIGMPYVWGGETDDTRGADGPQVHGGYDCSGFVWRVFKLSGNPAGRSISGRTAADQAGEIPMASRVPFEGIHPADLVFFGKATLHSSPRGIIHEGIALSPDFMINASGQGVYVSPLFEQWRRDEFAWGRRVVR